MAAICGVVYPDLFQAGPSVFPLLQALATRSPGNHNEYSYRNLTIACCGTEICANNNKSVWCMADGQLYHTQTLRKQLSLAGRSLPPHAPTEQLLLAAYETWEIDFLEKVTGDFALAILDQSRNELILARDRVGRKPLYWYHQQRQLLFASELKALLASDIVPSSPSPDAMAAYLFFGFMPQDMSPIAGVNKLLPGHYLRLRLNHNKSIHSYWSYSSLFNPDATYRASGEQEKLEQLLQQAVKARLPNPKQKVACLVSGGLGSAAVAYYLRKAHERTEAVTVTFSGQNEADLHAANITCSSLEIPHLTEQLSARHMLDELPNIVWHLDEPLADPNIVITWHLAKLAVQEASYSFSGMGSDEILAGHSRFMVEESSCTVFRTATQRMKALFKRLFLKPLSLLWPSAALRFLKHYPTNPLQERYLNENALLNGATAKRAAPAIAHLFDPEIFLHRFYNIDRIGTDLDAMLYLDVKTRLVDLYVLQYDRLMTCHQLEWRAPFLDRYLIEFIAPLPQGGYRSEAGGSLLKSLLSKTFPPSLVERPKVLRPDLLRGWLDDLQIRQAFSYLLDGTLVGNGLISGGWVRGLLDAERPTTYQKNPFLCLWSLLCLELWFRLYIDRPVGHTPPNQTAIELLRG